MLEVEQAGSTAVLTLNDPARRNILSAELCQAISAAVAEAEANPDVKAIVVAAAGKAFCAGADLSDLRAAAKGDEVNVQLVYKSFMDVANCSLPTIAAVNGAAVGAGFNLALACDMRVASQAAVFDTRFLKIGLHPGGGHGWMLLRAVGWAEAMRLLLLGQELTAAEALRIGLVQKVSAPEAVLEEALALAAGVDALPKELLVSAKASLRLAATSTHESSFAHETQQQKQSLRQPAFEERITQLQTSLRGR